MLAESSVITFDDSSENKVKQDVDLNSTLISNLSKETRHSLITMDGQKRSESENDRITLNLRGTKFDVFTYLFDKLPDSRLGRLKTLYDCLKSNQDTDSVQLALYDICDTYDLNLNEFYFNRDPCMLNPILNYYSTGDFHVNENFCTNFVLDELNFWNIHEVLNERCCSRKHKKKMSTTFENRLLKPKRKFSIYDKASLSVHQEKDDEDDEDEFDVNESTLFEKKNGISIINEFDDSEAESTNSSKRCPELRKRVTDLLEDPNSSIFAKVCHFLSKLFVLIIHVIK